MSSHILELSNRRVVNASLALLFKLNILIVYWPYDFKIVVYTLNHVSSKVIHDVSSYLKLFHKQPNLFCLRVFGSLYFPCLKPLNKSKLRAHSIVCTFIRYAQTQHGYLCLDMKSKKINISRHVVFSKIEFPFVKPSSKPAIQLIPNLCKSFLALSHIPSWLASSLSFYTLIPIEFSFQHVIMCSSNSFDVPVVDNVLSSHSAQLVLTPTNYGSLPTISYVNSSHISLFVNPSCDNS